MPARKIRVELFDSEGNKYTIAFEGQITRDKALHLLDLVELLGGSARPDGGSAGVKIQNSEAELSKYDKMRSVIAKTFPLVWFSSRDVLAAYEQNFNQPLGLSTAATYLSRMAAKGNVLKSGASNNLKYRLVTDVPQPTLRQRIS